VSNFSALRALKTSKGCAGSRLAIKFDDQNLILEICGAQNEGGPSPHDVAWETPEGGVGAQARSKSLAQAQGRHQEHTQAKACLARETAMRWETDDGYRV
jgi:hypothetical protein